MVESRDRHPLADRERGTLGDSGISFFPVSCAADTFSVGIGALCAVAGASAGGFAAAAFARSSSSFWNDAADPALTVAGRVTVAGLATLLPAHLLYFAAQGSDMPAVGAKQPRVTRVTAQIRL